MVKSVASVLLLTLGCNHWVRPEPPPPRTRTVDEARDMAVTVRVTCQSVGGRVDRVASGVAVTDWQVLTARHVVDCPTYPDIWVETWTGERWRFAPEREWAEQDVARIQIRSRDRLRIRDARGYQRTIIPPSLREPSWGEQVFLFSAWPHWGELPGVVLSVGPWTVRTSAETTGGMSGSGVYDEWGHLVGIHTASWSGPFGTGAELGRATEEMVP